MLFKSLNRFVLFGLALMAMLFFFGVQPHEQNHQNSNESVVVSHETHVHSAHQERQPGEIENKEEQPTSEDDQPDEDGDGKSLDKEDSVAVLSNFGIGSSDVADSHEQTQHHAPIYVRLRSIII